MVKLVKNALNFDARDEQRQTKCDRILAETPHDQAKLLRAPRHCAAAFAFGRESPAFITVGKSPDRAGQTYGARFANEAMVAQRSQVLSKYRCDLFDMTDQVTLGIKIERLKHDGTCHRMAGIGVTMAISATPRVLVGE